jgi:hypothetical protein
MARTNICRNIKIGTLSAYPINRIGDNAEERIKEGKRRKHYCATSALNKVEHAGHHLMVFKFVQNTINAKVLIELHFFFQINKRKAESTHLLQCFHF